jgi:hypothetical protein
MVKTEAQLSRMRGRQEATMTDTCTIRRVSARGNDGLGGRGPGSEASVTVACRIAPMSLQREEQYASKLGGSAGVVVTVAIGTEIAGSPIVTTDTIELTDGRKLNIIGFGGPHTNQTAQQIYCGVTG